MANAAQNAPKLEVGKLSVEDADRLADSFRPAWELDDAPFTQGNGLSAADVDALANGAGVTPSIRRTFDHDAVTLIEQRPVGHVPAPDDAKVEIAVDLDVEPDPTPPPVAQARPQQQAVPASRSKPYTPPRAPPQTVKMHDAGASGEYAPAKKSSMGLVLGVVGVIVLVGGILGIRAMMSGDKTTTSTTADTSTAHEQVPFPPPPPPPDTPVAQVAQTAPTATT